MARKASMTVEQAETDMIAAGFIRPIAIQFDRDQTRKANARRIIRKWFSAKGIPSMFSGGLSYAECEKAYNDMTGAEFAKVKRKFEQFKEESGNDAADSDDDESAETSTETTTASVPRVVVNPEGAPDVNHVAQLLAQLLAKGALDKDAVNALIDLRFSADLPDLVAKYANVHRVELVAQDGTATQVEGHAHPKLATLIKAMSARQANGKHPNIFLSGPTGSGKTHAVEQASAALGLEYYSNGAISMDYQLIGFKDAAGNYHETPLRKAFARKATYLFDEIDSSQNSPLLCLAGALANNGFPFPDAFVERHPDCIIIAAGNTWGTGATAEFVGRNKLDAAILSRFPVRISWDYDESLERNISGNVDWACRVQKARAAARAAGLKVTIDPRMTQAGAALIASGFSSNDAADMTYLANLSADQRRIVEA